MSKQLYVAFTTEGGTDEAFLGTIIHRTIDHIASQNGYSFSLEGLIWLGSAKGETTLAKINTGYYERGAQMLIIHRDTDQHTPQFILDHHITPLLTRVPENIRAELQIVPLIIRHEQETWLFADLDALDHILKGNLDRRSLNLPPDIETRANTKELFHQVIRTTNAGRNRGRRLEPAFIAEQLAEIIDLDRLARLESYRRFVNDTQNALRNIGYLPS